MSIPCLHGAEGDELADMSVWPEKSVRMVNSVVRLLCPVLLERGKI